MFGEVLIAGINAKEYCMEDLWSLIGYVLQKNVLFSGDIVDNLNFGNENGTEEEWKKIAKAAYGKCKSNDGGTESQYDYGCRSYSGGR